jgi:hypothetical protein
VGHILILIVRKHCAAELCMISDRLGHGAQNADQGHELKKFTSGSYFVPIPTKGLVDHYFMSE